MYLQHFPNIKPVLYYKVNFFDLGFSKVLNFPSQSGIVTRDFSRGRSSERALGPFDNSVCSKSLQRCAVFVGFAGKSTRSVQ